ncbi:MAG TPA: hypothetical protein VM513_15235 [Kofleriaceae bacterium]|jgi:hypothetical protein|nr:hypothetical protein [Kofleriaceae bacterium]
MSELETLAALRELEAEALLTGAAGRRARTLLDAWGARERELERVIAERDRVTAERDDLARREQLFRGALSGTMDTAARSYEAAQDGGFKLAMERVALLCDAKRAGCEERMRAAKAAGDEKNAEWFRAKVDVCETLARDIRDHGDAIVATAREKHRAGDVWRDPWGRDRVVQCVLLGGVVCFEGGQGSTEAQLRAAGWAPKVVRAARVVNHAGGNRVHLEDLERDIRALDPAAIIAAAREREPAPAQETAEPERRDWEAAAETGGIAVRDVPYGAAVMEMRYRRAQETAGEAPHAVGDVWEHDEFGRHTVRGVSGDDHVGPIAVEFVEAPGGRLVAMMLALGWRRVHCAEQPGTAEPGGE